MFRSARNFVGFSVILLILILGSVQVAHAAGFVVNSTGDASDSNPGDGVCADGSGNCTLRAAVEEANALTGSDTITLTAGSVYTLTLGQLSINSQIVIAGEGATVTADGASRVFYVAGTGNLSLKNITVRDGFSEVGGGILVDSGGALNVLNSAIISNTSTGAGGGISNYFGTINIANSTISGNRAYGNGGGIDQRGFSGSGVGNLTNVTIVNNTSDWDGSGGGDGGGIYTLSSLLNLKNSLVAANSVGPTGYFTEPDCLNLFGLTSLGYNLIGATDNGTLFPPGTPNANNDFVGTYSAPLNPLLGGLTGNPAYHPLQAGSLAVDRIPGSAATLVSSGVNPLFADGDPLVGDQRGAPRAGGPGQGGSAADIGAYEYDSNPTAVTLVRFEAIPDGAAIRLEWETAHEIDSLGFYLHRSSARDGEYVLLGDGLIPCKTPGLVGGAVYTWYDADVEPGERYFYRLQEVDVSGRNTFYGPVSAVVTPVFRLYLPLISH